MYDVFCIIIANIFIIKVEHVLMSINLASSAKSSLDWFFKQYKTSMVPNLLMLTFNLHNIYRV